MESDSVRMTRTMLFWPAGPACYLCETGKENRRNQTMPRGGLRSTSFKAGVSGNPEGRPKKADTIEAKKIIADVRTLAREIAPEALETLKSVMLDTKAPPAARIGAATAILDRGYGKPGQAVNISGAVETYDLEKLSDEDLETLVRILTPVAPIGDRLGAEGATPD